MNPKIISERNVESEMNSIGVDPMGIAKMLDKSVFRIVKLSRIRNAMANILKQEMLSIGGDVAVHRGCVNCTVESSDVLIFGTFKQYKELVKRMNAQVSEGKNIAKEIINIIEIF